MNMKFAAALALSGALILPIYSMAADSTTDTTGEYVDDASITMKVKASFAEDKWIKGRHVSVRTDKGVVDLTGSVKTKEESDRATELATKIKGVQAVHNNLKVEAS